MQLRADWDPTTTCLGCHDAAKLGGADRPAGHGGHGDGVDCVGCHMPRTAYGLLGGIISHRITTPAPASLVGRHDEPDACTQCHVDRSRSWAAAALPGLGLGVGSGGPTPTPAPEESWASRVVLDLHGGDPIQRALAVHALGRAEVPVPASDRLAWIVDAMADDYAAVRWMAWRGGQQLAAELGDDTLTAALAGFDPSEPIERRLASWQRLRDAVGPGPFASYPERQQALELRRDGTAIWIGE